MAMFFRHRISKTQNIDSKQLFRLKQHVSEEKGLTHPQFFFFFFGPAGPGVFDTFGARCTGVFSSPGGFEKRMYVLESSTSSPYIHTHS